MHQRSLLVVEENPGVLLTCAETLERAGYSVRTASDGLSGMRTIDDASTALRLVLTDLEMPGASGLELAEHSRRVRPELPLILMSGNLDERARRVATPLGMDMLEKPFAMTRLLDLVRSAAGAPNSRLVRDP